ncbi:MAG: BamA/TamA family outer membrane protein [Bacteroidales bacterium]|nr:BamA/TamA family outer membrane protein [Bacteroidales bacterium]
MKYKALNLILIILIFASCSPNRHLSKDGYLLSKNKININNKTIAKGDIGNYIQQDPNHKFLGVKAGMYIYSASRPGDDSICNFFEKFVLRTLGDKPIEINNDQTELSCRNIKTYLKTHGCFDANITTSYSEVKKWYAPWKTYKRRRQINYNIDVPSRAVIDTFIVQVEDPKIERTVKSMLKDNPVQKGQWYNEDLLVSLRSDVSLGMQSKGYYTFAPKYIAYNIDTTEGIDKTKIIMVIKNPEKNASDSNDVARHKPYKISKIYLHSNYISPQSPDYIPDIDTVLFYHKQQRGYKPTPLYFITNTEKPIIKERTIMRSILMQNKNLFSPEASQNTYSSLFQLKNFKYIDISYENITKGVQDTNELACYIRLTRNKPISLASSFELNYSASNEPINNNTSSNFGMAGNLSYTDKNLLHGAEIFTTNLKLAAEINSNIFKKDNERSGWDIFNAFEAGLDFGIELPRFLAPFSTSFYSMKFHPHTSIKTGYNIQKRSYYERSIFTLNYGYSWNTTEKRYFAFIPLEVNYVNMEITSQSYADLIRRMDKRIQYQMSDHLVMAMRFSYNYNGQTTNQKQDFNYFSWNLETAGNLLDLYSVTFNQSKDAQGHYTIFNIPFSQYVRTDFSFTHYNYLTQNTSFVYKFYGGIGVSYANAEALPYEKSFFGGGANGLRAWQLRSLGPGCSVPTGDTKYDRAGDISFGANFEYRFPIMGFLEGATFLDLGNIWTLRDQQGMDGGKISEDFYKEIAAGVGFGVRLNIKVFILRFDFALKAWDPSKELKERFVLDNSKFSDIAVQFGIGYPF